MIGVKNNQINCQFFLKQAINLKGFGSIENKVVVPFAASFSKFLLQSFGLDRYKQMYVLLKETDSSEINVRTIEKVYELNEQQLLDMWKKSVLG